LTELWPRACGLAFWPILYSYKYSVHCTIRRPKHSTKLPPWQSVLHAITLDRIPARFSAFSPRSVLFNQFDPFFAIDPRPGKFTLSKSRMNKQLQYKSRARSLLVLHQFRLRRYYTPCSMKGRHHNDGDIKY